jgi:putative ABC transport system ATP-binding protein
MGHSSTSPNQNFVYRTQGLKRFYGEGAARVEALRGVDLDLPLGELIVFLGPSGSGKSTFLNILGGLDRASEGRVWFRDADLTTMNDDALTLYRRRHVGFVFQFYNLMPSLTARENVELVTEIAQAPMDAAEALDMVGLAARRDHFPSQLSGGEQQRVAIARALARRPDVLFCDEPTGALDSSTGRAVLHALQEVNRSTGATVMIVTHAAATAAMANRVIEFSDGRVRRISVNDSPVSAEAIEW